MSKNFLIPLLTLKDNGGNAVALALARQLVRDGNVVTIMASSYHSSMPRNRQENGGIDFLTTPSIHSSPLISVIILLFSACLFSLIKRPRLIYTHMVTGLILNFSRVKPIMLVQDIEYRFFTGISRIIMKRIFGWVTDRSRLLVTSHRLSRYFRLRRSVILYASDVGVSSEIFKSNKKRGRSVRSNDFLLVAKKGAHKRHTETVQLAEIAAQLGSKVVLIDQDRKASSGADGKDGLVIYDAVTAERMLSLYRASRVFISLSRYEGYGLTPLEALLSGCFVLTTVTPSTTNMKHQRLEVLYGSHDIVKRATAAIFHLKARSIDFNEDAGDQACHVPSMEDWAKSASRLIKSTD